MTTDQSSPSPAVTLPDVKMNLYRPKEPVMARVTENRICTVSKKAAGFVRHLAFDVSGTELEGNCVPGQAIGVVAPGVDDRGKPHKVRLYSLASPEAGEDGEGKIISTTVKRLIDEDWDDHGLFVGVASNHLCDLCPGDEVALTGPNGKRFLLPADAEHYEYVFFATGTGIAPFRGMVMELLSRKVPGRIVLVMGAPYASDLLYDDYFRQMDDEHENFTYLPTISRHVHPDGAPRMYVQDRLQANGELFAPLLAGDRTLIYICGIAGMEVGIYQHLPQAYLEGDRSGVPADGWSEAVKSKAIHPGERVFVEVYA